MLSDPTVITDPTITIDGVDYLCATNKVSLIPEDSATDVSTFCNPGGEAPGATTWTCSLDLKLGYTNGTEDGSWNLLHALRRKKVTIVVAPRNDTASASNPTATFEAYIPSIPLIDAEPGAVTEYTLEVKSVGEPVFAAGA